LRDAVWRWFPAPNQWPRLCLRRRQGQKALSAGTASNVLQHCSCFIGTLLAGPTSPLWDRAGLISPMLLAPREALLPVLTEHQPEQDAFSSTKRLHVASRQAWTSTPGDMTPLSVMLVMLMSCIFGSLAKPNFNFSAAWQRLSDPEHPAISSIYWPYFLATSPMICTSK